MADTQFSGIWRKENWIQFKLYDDPSIERNWKGHLNWYHTMLRSLRPIIENEQDILISFFTVYGPQHYDAFERVIAEKSLPNPPDRNVRFIKLRIFPLLGRREQVRGSLEERFDACRGLWDYETLREYDVTEDLGNRYGRNENGTVDHDRTLRFMKYWDAGCRYILSVIAESGTWQNNVDVWGIPHLINNALGGWLRVPNGKCDCGGDLCIGTSYFQNATPVTMSVTSVPLFLTGCSSCDRMTLRSINI